jgi:hypothetical protein
MIFLGTIANVGSDVLDNTNTAAAFAIPAGTARLFVQPSAATMMASVVTAGASAPAAAAMLQLGAANSIQEIPVSYPLTTGKVLPIVLAIRKTDAGAGTTKVFAAG